MNKVQNIREEVVELEETIVDKVHGGKRAKAKRILTNWVIPVGKYVLAGLVGGAIGVAIEKSKYGTGTLVDETYEDASDE